MKTITAIVLTIMFICTAVFLSEKAYAETPKEAIQGTVDAVLTVLRDTTLSLPEKKMERRDKIRLLIRDRFNFEEMSKRSLARHWKPRTPEEAAEFTDIFADLLVSSYISKIEAYTDEKVIYDKEVMKGKGKYAMVSTTIVTKDVDIPIDYKAILMDGKWWVYDVVVEGVSFISTYRSQYNKIIVSESYAKLIEKMKKKLQDVNTM